MAARRSVLRAGLAASLLPALGHSARAQDAARSRDVMLTIAMAKAQAENLLAMALYAKLSPESGKTIDGANERILVALRGVLSGIPAEEAIIYAEPAQTMIAEQMVERGVPVMPETVPPVVSQGSPGGSEELAAVAGDIVKEAFGVTNLDPKGLARVASELGLADILSRIGGMIRAGEWALAAAFLRALLAQLGAAAQTVPALEGALGPQAVKEILAAASARFAPFIGWPILIASILFAIMKHRNRLLSALEKAR